MFYYYIMYIIYNTIFFNFKPLETCLTIAILTKVNILKYAY